MSEAEIARIGWENIVNLGWRLAVGIIVTILLWIFFSKKYRLIRWGAVLVVLGSLLNFIVVYANGGFMPVANTAAEKDKFSLIAPPQPFYYVTKNTKFKLLADKWQLRTKYYIGDCYSLGDFLFIAVLLQQQAELFFSFFPSIIRKEIKLTSVDFNISFNLPRFTKARFLILISFYFIHIIVASAKW